MKALQELALLKQSYEYTWKSSRYSDYATFTAANGDTIAVEFERDSVRPQLNGWGLNFQRITPSGGSTSLMTGTGDAFRIFATVIAAVREFFQRQRPGYVAFSAIRYEPSRVRLYRRMFKSLQNVPGYSKHSDTVPGEHIFYLYLPKHEELIESFITNLKKQSEDEP